MVIRRLHKRFAALSLLGSLGLLASCGAQSKDSSRTSDSRANDEQDGGARPGKKKPPKSQVGPTGATGNTGGNTVGASGNTDSIVGPTGPTGNTNWVGPSGQTSAVSIGGSGGSGYTGATPGPTGGSGGGWGGSGGSGAAGYTGPVGSSGGYTGPTGASGYVPPSPIEFSEPWTLSDACEPESRSLCADVHPWYRYTDIGGYNSMPLIEWHPGPEETKSYALTFQDLTDANVHWAVWDLPANTMSLSESSLPQPAHQSALIGSTWLGPDACDNAYELVLYAVGEESLDLEPSTPPARVFAQLQEADAGALVLTKASIRMRPQEPCGY